MVALTQVQPNILVDDTGRARITDFGLARVTQSLGVVRAALDDDARGHTARWTAPEILRGAGSHSKEADVFSFAMVVIEVGHRWVFSFSLSLLPYRTIAGVHRCCSFLSYPIFSGYDSYSGGEAPFTSSTPRLRG